MTMISKLHEKWLDDAEYREAYDALDAEFALAAALIEARAGRSDAGGGGAAHADDAGDDRAAGERAREASTARLRRFAEATGTRLRINFEPAAKAG